MSALLFAELLRNRNIGSNFGSCETGSSLFTHIEWITSEHGEAKRSPAIKMDDDLLELYNSWTVFGPVMSWYSQAWWSGNPGSSLMSSPLRLIMNMAPDTSSTWDLKLSVVPFKSSIWTFEQAHCGVISHCSQYYTGNQSYPKLWFQFCGWNY